MRRPLLGLKTQAAGKFFYLATPYTHTENDVRDRRADEANRIAGLLMREGLYVYSPIWNCHKCAQDNALPTDYLWWLKFNEAFINPSAGVIVVQLPGWLDSKGVKYEIEYAKEMFLPVFYLNPESLEVDDEHPI